MASINKVILVGNLGRDPEMRYMTNGDAACNLALATTDKWKDKNSGEAKEATEWHRVSIYGKLAEIAGQYLKKGSQVYIEGSLKTRKWTDKEGVERFTTEVNAHTLQMLGAAPARRDDDDGRNTAPPARNSKPAQPQGRGKPAPNFSDMDDDIPF